MKTFIASFWRCSQSRRSALSTNFSTTSRRDGFATIPTSRSPSRYTGDERDRLEQQLAPETMEYKKSRILMVGYGPPSTGFSLALKRIGDRLKARFGDEVDVKYVYNILDLGYREDDINWLVEEGVLIGYQSSGYFSERVPRSTVASG